MATAQELELLALLAEERRRNATVEPVAMVESLPDLTPEMLLSPSAQREIEAARSISGYMREPLAAQAPAAPRFPVPREAFRREAAIDIESNDMGDIDLDAGAPPMMPNEDQLLSSLFMGREAQDALAAGGIAPGGSGGYDIDFDADSMLEGRTTPNESARWQVGRQDPPRLAFTPGAPASGPSDGVVVSARAGDGSWQRTAAAQAAAAPRPAPARPIPQGRPVAPRSNVHRPTVYEHIMKGGLVGDDD